MFSSDGDLHCPIYMPGEAVIIICHFVSNCQFQHHLKGQAIATGHNGQRVILLGQLPVKLRLQQ